MTRIPTTFRRKAAALALVAMTSAALPVAPALADGRHYHPHGWDWDGGDHWRGYDRHGYDRHGYDRHDHDDGAAVALAAGVGLLLGAALMAQPRPDYYTPPPAAVYAPPPPAYYGQPLEAYPASDVYQTRSGQYCREYTSTIHVGGRLQQGYGTACLGEDGAWRVVN